MLIQTPVYNIFYNSILNNGRRVLPCDLIYENGEYSTIELKWNDSRKVLEIGARNGSYTGMPAQRSIRVTVGDSSKEISYNGHRVKVRF